MKSKFFLSGIALIFLSIVSLNSLAQQAGTTPKKGVLKTYLIERDIPKAGQLSAAELKGVSQKSCTVLKEMGPGIEWIQSYVTGDKIFCIYKASHDSLLVQHGKKGGFPITKITEIENIISPQTATQ